MKAGLNILIVAFAAVILCAGVSGRAVSAVRVCSAHVTSKVTRSAHEAVARKAAIKDWLSKAKSALVKHPSWRLANLKVIKCVKWHSGFECVAHGAPCTIKQKLPKRRKVPRHNHRELAPPKDV